METFTCIILFHAFWKTNVVCQKDLYYESRGGAYIHIGTLLIIGLLYSYYLGSDRKTFSLNV
jgi:hypothetical protein